VISSHRWGFVCIILLFTFSVFPQNTDQTNYRVLFEEILDKYPEQNENAAWSQYYKVDKMSLIDEISRRNFLKNTSKAVAALPLAGLGMYAWGQEAHQVDVINIEVPTRVFKDKKFLDTLTIGDFEVLENGILQKLDAMYLVNKTDIQRKEGAREFNPDTGRNHYLIFQITQYNSKIEEGIEHFFANSLSPNDNLNIWTPIKRYALTKEALQKKSNKELAEELNKIIRKDISIGMSEYKSLIRALKRHARTIQYWASGTVDSSQLMRGMESDLGVEGLGINFALERYSQTLQKLESIRNFDIKGFAQFAEILKKQPGENNIHFFYEREYKPELSSRTMNRLIDTYHDDVNIMGQVQVLFQSYHQNININNELLAQVYADSGVLFNFIFLDIKKENSSGITMKESSEDIFRALSDVSTATGGKVINTSNPAAAFKETSELSDNYYLLYYTPQNFRKDNTFKNIEVRVKGRDDLTIQSRKGYFAK